MIETLSSDYSTLKFYVVSAVSALKATVVLADIGIDDISVDDLSVVTLAVSGATTLAALSATTGAFSDDLLMNGSGKSIINDQSENAQNSKFEAICPNNKTGFFGFSDPENSLIGYMGYAHTTNTMTFITNTSTALTLGSDQSATFAADVSVGGNIAQNATLESWHSNWEVMQQAGRGSLVSYGSFSLLGNNYYIDDTSLSSSSKYIDAGVQPTRYLQNDGAHTFSYAATGAADGSITWVDSLTLGDDGAAAFVSTVTIGAYTLPATDGTNGQVLMTNGSGVLTWTTP